MHQIQAEEIRFTVELVGNNLQQKIQERRMILAVFVQPAVLYAKHMHCRHGLHCIDHFRALNVFDITDQLQRCFERDNQRFSFRSGGEDFELSFDQNI
ncbi:hypothetical protein D3C75_1153050 [compost metagenome]